MSEVFDELVVLCGVIDNMDVVFIYLFVERFWIICEVGCFKVECGLFLVDFVCEVE